MAVLATFDAAGQWADTHVCDHLIARHLADQGVDWGRWEGDAALAQLRQRFSSKSAEQLRLVPDSAEWEALRPRWRAAHRREGVELRCVREGTQLLHLRTDSGFLALLCEAGEWVALPGEATRSFDAGDAPELDVFRAWAGAEVAAEPSAHEAMAPLPSLDSFVETMLELTGHAADED